MSRRIRQGGRSGRHRWALTHPEYAEGAVNAANRLPPHADVTAELIQASRSEISALQA